MPRQPWKRWVAQPQDRLLRLLGPGPPLLKGTWTLLPAGHPGHGCTSVSLMFVIGCEVFQLLVSSYSPAPALPVLGHPGAQTLSTLSAGPRAPE